MNYPMPCVDYQAIQSDMFRHIQLRCDALREGQRLLQIHHLDGMRQVPLRLFCHCYSFTQLQHHLLSLSRLHPQLGYVLREVELRIRLHALPQAFNSLMKLTR